MAHPFSWRDVSTIPPRPWIFGKSLLRGSVSLLIAPGGSGKTALTAGMAASLVTGRDLLGIEVFDGPKKVWLWNLEDSRDELAKLLHAAFIWWNICEEDIGDRLHINSGPDGDSLVTATDERGRVRLHQNVLDELVSEISRLGIDVLIVDPFVSSHQVSENDNGSIDAVMKAWGKLAVACNCAVLLVHHTGKLRGNENTADSARGASALVNAARSVLTINRLDQTEAAKRGIGNEERHRYFRILDDKNNRAPPAVTSEWFKMESVSLGNGPTGNLGDSMPVVVPWSRPELIAHVAFSDLVKVQAAVAAGIWHKSDQCEDWVGVAIAGALDLDLRDPATKPKLKRLLVGWLETDLLRVEDKKDRFYKLTPHIVVGRLLDAELPPPNDDKVEGGGGVEDQHLLPPPPL